MTYEAVRLLDAPIIDASSHASIGHNIQGPSLIRVPDWVPDALRPATFPNTLVRHGPP